MVGGWKKYSRGKRNDAETAADAVKSIKAISLAQSPIDWQRLDMHPIIL